MAEMTGTELVKCAVCKRAVRVDRCGACIVVFENVQVGKVDEVLYSCERRECKLATDLVFELTSGVEPMTLWHYRRHREVASSS